MKILVLTNEYPYEQYPKPNWTKVIRYFCENWVRLGHDVVCIVNSTCFPEIYYGIGKYIGRFVSIVKDINPENIEDTSWTKKFSFELNGVRVFNLPMKKYWPGGIFTQDTILRQIDSVKQTIDSINFTPDAMTGHWVNPQLPLLVELKKIYQVPTTLVFHGDYSDDRLNKIHAKELIQYIDHIGCRSASAATKIQEKLRLKQKPFVCSSGVPDSYIEEYSNKQTFRKFDENKLSIITAGRLVKYKCFDAIIEAVSGLGLDDYSLCIAGDGPQKQFLQMMIEVKNIYSNVQMCGLLNREELQKIMKETQVFVLISKNETFGLVYLEAMLHGCIVIASIDGGVDGIIIDGVNGFLCKEGDHRQLRDILLRIKDLPIDKKIKIAKAASDTASKLSDRNVAKLYLEHIK